VTRAAALTFALLLALARPALAHPAGSTSVNRYVGVSCSASGEVRMAYLLDFAELPAYAEIEQLDADHDGNVTPEEQRAYLERRLPPLVSRWTVEVDGARASVRVAGSNLQVLPGEQGLSTLRIAADLAVDAGLHPDFARGADLRVHVVDPVFADRSGWRQMSAEPSPGVTVTGGPDDGGVDILAYSSAGGEPPRVDDARFTFRARTEGGAVGGQGAGSQWTRRARFAGLAGLAVAGLIAVFAVLALGRRQRSG
jgi:hypothetical protein